MIQRLWLYGFRALSNMAIPPLRKNIPLLFALVLVGTVLVALTACTSDSSTFGQYKKGRTLHFSVVSLERTPELRYSTCDVLAGSSPPTCDPEGVRRSWSISASTPDTELVLVRAKVENHTAVSTFVNVDRSSAELRDLANNTYFPLPVSDTALQDFRGESEALVSANLGECYDGDRALVDVGSSVKWQNEAEEAQKIVFNDPSVAVGQEGKAEVGPGGSLVHTFGQEGTYPYNCSGPEGTEWPAVLRVAEPESGSDYIDRTTRFLNGSFELLQGHGVDGFMIFEAPVDTQFRDMRWRAGDSILFNF